MTSFNYDLKLNHNVITMNLLVFVLLQLVGVVKALATYVTIVLSYIRTFAYVPLKKLSVIQWQKPVNILSL